ncbi:MAG: alpha/beta hydrolase [Oscillospiraceae bacterium]|nr:alpha/beta hydrolase [Oscillospiraceae bacterium]
MPYVGLIAPDPGDPFAMPLMDVSQITRKWQDIDYTPSNPHPARKLDVYLPETGAGPFPTLICIHGGAFWGGEKRDFQTAAYMEAIPHGFAVVSVEQRLCKALPDGGYDPDGLFPNPVCDYKAAIRYLRANAATYMLDANRFALCGGSAGGYHAVIAAASANNDVLYDKTLGFADIPGDVQAVVSWFGVGDLILQSEFITKIPMMKLPDGTEMQMANFADIFLGVNARENTNLAYFASPSTWITKEMPPTLIQSGAADEVVPIACSREIVAKICEICGDDRVVYDEFPDYGHGDERFSSPENIARMLAWLKQTLSC